MPKKSLLIASTNLAKIKEFRALLKDLTALSVFGLNDFIDNPEVVNENGDNYCANAFLKADYWHKRLGIPVLADDTGLEVLALNGYPGLLSSRIAKTDKLRRETLLTKAYALSQFKEKGYLEASFFCCLCFRNAKITKYFNGELKGFIKPIETGAFGFGYDPIFYLRDGKSLADRTSLDKNELSHRAKAIFAFKACLVENDLL